MADFIEFKMIGGEKFLADLATWGRGLQQQAQAAANDAADRVVTYTSSHYTEGPTGNLKKGVRKVSADTSGAQALARVRSFARHAHLYEWGTQRRQTAKGANRGRMPSRPTFVPIAIAQRNHFLARLRAILDKPVTI